MIALVQTITLLTGLILLLLAGYQDFKDHKPTLIMPAMILIGLSQSIIIGMLIFIYSAFTLFLLPNKINKIFGKADVFFIMSLLTLMIIIRDLTILGIIITSSFITLGLIFCYIKQKPKELLPWVGLYVLGLTITTLIYPIILLLMRLL